MVGLIYIYWFHEQPVWVMVITILFCLQKNYILNVDWTKLSVFK